MSQRRWLAALAARWSRWAIPFGRVGRAATGGIWVMLVFIQSRETTLDVCLYVKWIIFAEIQKTQNILKRMFKLGCIQKSKRQRIERRQNFMRETRNRKWYILTFMGIHIFNQSLIVQGILYFGYCILDWYSFFYNVKRNHNCIMVKVNDVNFI